MSGLGDLFWIRLVLTAMSGSFGAGPACGYSSVLDHVHAPAENSASGGVLMLWAASLLPLAAVLQLSRRHPDGAWSSLRESAPRRTVRSVPDWRSEDVVVSLLPAVSVTAPDMPGHPHDQTRACARQHDD